MSDTAIKIENLSKQYRLGLVSTGTVSHDINRWWCKMVGKEDSYLKIGESNDRTSKGESDYVWALKDINLEVKRGERIGIIGKNGAGKSTLLKILSQVTGSTTGSVKMKGRVGALLEVGTGFHPELTGRENIYMNGTILGMKRWEVKAKLDEIVDFAGVERYSSGMMVRLGFAVAAHLEPDILIVDEVLAVGDAEFQKKAIGKMKDVSEGNGRTVLFVSHNMASIQLLCNKCILFNNGGILKEGLSQDVINYYLEGDYEQSSHCVTWKENVITSSNDVRLISGEIEQSNNPFALKNVAISEQIYIKFKYKVLKKKQRLYSVILLRYKTHFDVLASSNGNKVSLTKDKFWNVPLEIGIYEAKCTIPANFLNEGLYSVTLAIGEHPSHTLILEKDVLSFNVCETGEMRDKFQGGWMGVIRPRLAWNTKKLE